MTHEPKVLFVFNRPREDRQRLYLSGKCPDDALYGFNEIRRCGFDASFSDAGHDFRGFSWPYLKLGDLLSSKGKRVGFHSWQAKKLRPEMAKADLIFATADSSSLPILRLKKRGAVRPPVVCATIGLTQGFSRKSGWLFSYYKTLLHQAERIIYFGYAEGEELKNHLGIGADKARFVPFGVDTAFYDRPNTDSGLGLAFGADPLRDWRLLAEAVRGTGIRIEAATYADLLRPLSLPSELTPLPLLPFDDIANKIAAASFIVLPVKENSYSGATISLLSAMAAGKAVIVSRTSAIANGYGLEDQKNCLLVPPGDATALRTALYRLREDINLRTALGTAAKKHVRQFHDIKLMSSQMASIFREAIR